MMDPMAGGGPPMMADPAAGGEPGIPDGEVGGGLTKDQVAETVKQVLEETGVVKPKKKSGDETMQEVHGMMKAIVDHFHIPYEAQPSESEVQGEGEGDSPEGQSPEQPADPNAAPDAIGESASQALGSLAPQPLGPPPEMSGGAAPKMAEAPDTDAGREALLNTMSRLRDLR